MGGRSHHTLLGIYLDVNLHLRQNAASAGCPTPDSYFTFSHTPHITLFSLKFEMKILLSWVKAQNYKHALQGERLTLSDIWCHPMGHKIGQMGSRLRGECVLDPFVLLHILPPSR